MDDSSTRFFLGLLSGYPICAFYYLINFICLAQSNKAIGKGNHNEKGVYHHFYFTITGLAMGYWTFGLGMIHGCVCVLVTWGALKIMYDVRLAMFLSKKSQADATRYQIEEIVKFLGTGFLFAFQLGYLVIGYIERPELDGLGTPYDWTTPHCVLCLRLIGLAMDAYDGDRLARGHNLGSKAFVTNAIATNKKESSPRATSIEIPALIEIMGYCFFVGGYFVGPQFSMNHYKRAIQNNLTMRDNKSCCPPISLVLKKLVIGLCLITVVWLAPFGVPGGNHLSTKEFIETSQFCESPWIIRFLYWSFWGQLILTKYVAIWILSEGAVILAGIGYNGKSEDGNQILWDGGENVKFPDIYFVKTGTDFMKSFNIKTSEWIGIYVFRRLKFMKSIVISQAMVFLFVALWHGLEFGYFAVFGLLSFSMLFDRFFFPYFEKTKIFTFYLAKNQGFELCRKVIGTACRLFCLPFIPMGFQVHSMNAFIRIGTCAGLQWLLVGYILVPFLTMIAEKIFIYGAVDKQNRD